MVRKKKRIRTRHKQKKDFSEIFYNKIKFELKMTYLSKLHIYPDNSSNLIHLDRSVKILLTGKNNKIFKISWNSAIDHHCLYKNMVYSVK